MLGLALLSLTLAVFIVVFFSVSAVAVVFVPGDDGLYEIDLGISFNSLPSRVLLRIGFELFGLYCVDFILMDIFCSGATDEVSIAFGMAFTGPPLKELSLFPTG